MGDAKKLPVPKWNVWITFVVFVLTAIGWSGFIIYTFINNISSSPGFTLGSLFMSIILLYLLVLVPCLVLWEYLRK